MAKHGITAEKIIEELGLMVGQRTNWESHWDELAKFIVPRKDNIFNENRTSGDKRNTNIYDSTAIISNELLAGALQSLLTNPLSQWFNLTTGIDELDLNDNVRAWLQLTERAIFKVLDGSNFQTEIHEVYLDLGAFGTGVLRMEEDDKIIIRFHARPIWQNYIKENSLGEVDTVYSRTRWSLRQIVQEFGKEKGFPDKLNKMADDTPSKELNIIHAIFPREDMEPDTKTPLKFASIWVIKEEKIILRNSGFADFPYAIPRWSKTSGEMYGRGPGMSALPDIKMINEVMKTTIRGAQKTVDPPLQMSDDGVTLPLKLQPGGLNYRRQGTDRIEPIVTGSRVDFGFQMIEQIGARIKQAFFGNQLQLEVNPRMTATEVNQRQEEKLRLLAPILARQQFELLRPIIDSVFRIMEKRNMIPPAPAEIEDLDLKVSYASPIAKAQRTSESQDLLRVIDLVGPLAEVDPTIIDNLDGDKAIRIFAKQFDLPQEMIRTEKAVEALRQDRAEQQQAAQQNEQELADAEKVQKAGPTLQAITGG